MNWKKLLKILGLLLFLILLGFWLRSDFWQVKRVDCQFNQLNCNMEIANKVGDLSLRQNILFFPRLSVINQVKKELTQVDSVKIKKRLPNKLIFELTSRKPVVALAIELSPEAESTVSAKLAKPQFSLTGVYYLVDQGGTVVKKMEENQNLPLILLGSDPQFKAGDKVTQEVLRTIEILIDMKLHLFGPKVARIDSLREIEIWLENETLVLLNGEKEVGIQLDSLQFIYSRSKIEGKQIKKIDLRFDKPVVLY